MKRLRFMGGVSVLFLVAFAVPVDGQVVDVNGDGSVGHHEALALARQWKQTADSLVGSTTNAELLDGLDSAQFLRRDVSDLFIGSKLTVDGLLEVGVEGASNHNFNVFGSEPGAKLHWDALRGALRAGRATEDQWDPANTGQNSIGLGYNTSAPASYSTAIGAETLASGDWSTALGEATIASGSNSTALGFETRASGLLSTAMGESTTASGYCSTSMGWLTTASGGISTALGSVTVASGRNSTAMGTATLASGDHSVAVGHSTKATGEGSFALGRLIEVSGNYSIGIGLSDQVAGVVFSQPETMAIMGGRVGIGSIAPNTRLSVEDDVAGPVATFVNEGDAPNRSGIQIRAGADNGSGTTDYLLALDGNGDPIGAIRNTEGAFSLVDLSDQTSKTEIRATEVDAVAIVEGLRVVDFKRKSNPQGPTLHGFIAQEAKEVYPEMVTQLDEDSLGISKDALIPILTKAIQEQQKTISELSSEVRRLRDLIEAD